jgi:hypothetical protein
LEGENNWLSRVEKAHFSFIPYQWSSPIADSEKFCSLVSFITGCFLWWTKLVALQTGFGKQKLVMPSFTNL